MQLTGGLGELPQFEIHGISCFAFHSSHHSKALTGWSHWGRVRVDWSHWGRVRVAWSHWGRVRVAWSHWGRVRVAWSQGGGSENKPSVQLFDVEDCSRS